MGGKGMTRITSVAQQESDLTSDVKLLLLHPSSYDSIRSRTWLIAASLPLCTVPRGTLFRIHDVLGLGAHCGYFLFLCRSVSQTRAS